MCIRDRYKVAINEAIEVAKVFGADESHKYINGVLDKVAPALGLSLIHIWFLLDENHGGLWHKGVLQLVKDLNGIYQKNAPLFELDGRCV